MTDFDRTYAMLPDDLVEYVIKTEYAERPPAAGDSAEVRRPDPNRARVKSLWAAAMAKAKAKPIPRPIRPKRL